MSPSIQMIVAAAENDAIGYGNKMPWHLPKDFQFFKEKTMGCPIIMGRKTWESIGRPLPGRRNIVITRNANFQAEGADVVPSLEAAIAYAETLNPEKIMIIGGGQIYQQGLKHADRIYLTRVATIIDPADTFFPKLEATEWKQVETTPMPAEPENNRPTFEFQTFDRR